MIIEKENKFYTTCVPYKKFDSYDEAESLEKQVLAFEEPIAIQDHPRFVYHGTKWSYLQLIINEGLKPCELLDISIQATCTTQTGKNWGREEQIHDRTANHFAFNFKEAKLYSLGSIFNEAYVMMIDTSVLSQKDALFFNPEECHYYDIIKPGIIKLILNTGQFISLKYIQGINAQDLKRIAAFKQSGFFNYDEYNEITNWKDYKECEEEYIDESSSSEEW